MAIEFRCPNCQKLLRVGDDAAGKQAKCPGCGTPVTVPTASAPPPPPASSPFGAGASDPFGSPPPQPAYGGDNPYAAPISLGGTRGMRGPAPPAWERDGASISSLIATVKEVFSAPSDFFATMRQDAGLGAPLLFFVILMMLSVIVALVVQFAFQGALMGAMQPQQGGGAPWQAMVGGGAILLVVYIVALAVILPISAFFNTGIFHLALMLFGGANRPFETTFRVYCYANGATAVIVMIPFCGSYIQGIIALVFTGIGLCYAHNTDGWRATLAVLAPMICCIGASVAILVVVFGSLAAAGGAGGPGGGNFGPPVQPQPFDPNQFNFEERWRLSPQAAAPELSNKFHFADGFAPAE